MKKIKLLAQDVAIRLNVGGDFVYLDTVGQEIEVSDEDFLFLQEQLNSIPSGFIQIIDDGQEQQKIEGEQVSGKRKKTKRE